MRFFPRSCIQARRAFFQASLQHQSEGRPQKGHIPYLYIVGLFGWKRCHRDNLTLRRSSASVWRILQSIAFDNNNSPNQTLNKQDFHVGGINLLANHVSCDAGVVQEVRIRAVRSLPEPIQIGMDNSARCTLNPLEKERHLLDFTIDVEIKKN